MKRYEGIKAGDVPDKVTVYTVGYPSTAYYPDGEFVLFTVMPYPPPPGYPEVEGFVEGTAHYITDISLDNTSSNSTYKKIYDLMTNTPPNGYILDKNGDYIVTRMATVYSYNYGIKYFSKTNTINVDPQIIKREFRYKKKINPNDYKNYYVKFTLNGTTLNCFCKRITFIPGTNSGNVTLGINIQLGDGRNSNKLFNFEWKMKDGINQNRYCNVPYYLGSGFKTRSDWEATRSDGSIVRFSFQIDHSSIPYPPHG